MEYAAKPYAFPMPKGSHLKPLFDYEITKLRDEGFIEHLRWKWWEQNPKRVLGYQLIKVNLKLINNCDRL